VVSVTPTEVRFFRFLDRDGRSNAPVAWASDHMFSWVPNTGAWHRNRAIEIDYIFDREFIYEEVTAAEAEALARDARPIDESTSGWLVDEYRAQPRDEVRTSDELGARGPADRPAGDTR
jgi:hypothetical protein